jgi:nitrogen-specific signal transduction histidine kinase
MAPSARSARWLTGRRRVMQELFRPSVSQTPDGTGLALRTVAKAMEAHARTAGLEECADWRTCFVLTSLAPPVLPSRMEKVR